MSAVVDFVAEIERIIAAAESEQRILDRLDHRLAAFARAAALVGRHEIVWNEERGDGEVALHQDPAGGVNLWLCGWRPGAAVGPHDHATWAIVAGIRGVETNTLWRHPGDGMRRHGPLENVAARGIGPGDAVAMPSDTIHDVANLGEETAYSLHLYGRDLASLRRYVYDIDTSEAGPIPW